MCVVIYDGHVSENKYFVKGTWERYTLCNFSVNLNYSKQKKYTKKQVCQATQQALNKWWLLLLFAGKSIGRKRKLQNFHLALRNSSCGQLLLQMLFHISSLHRLELGGTEICLVHPPPFPDEEIELGEKEARRGKIMIIEITEITARLF